MSSPLWAVLPGGIDDPAAPSGGNRYDRTVLTLLAGRSVPDPAEPAAPDFRELGPSSAARDPNFPEIGQTAAGQGPNFLEIGAGVPPRDVHEIAVNGDWPTPAPAARAALARALAEIPDKSDVLLDGLVACGVPEILEPHHRRLKLRILVHLPLGDETGLDPATAARLRARERAALHLATTVIATSTAAATHISVMHGLSGVAVAEPGVDPAAPAVPDPSGRRLLCVASVIPRKGQDLLVRVLENDLADLDWDCTFVGALIRPVPYTSANLHFVGPRTGKALADAYGMADLLVLPSRAETYGMVVTEALARALPVIATRVGGVPEALGPTMPGLLIPPDDPAALAAALRRWLTEPALRERLRATARERRETLPTWTATARRLSEVLDS